MNIYRPHVAYSGGSAGSGNPRPLWVYGPSGEVLTLESLPAPDTRRWVARRKAEVIAAIRGGLLSEADACARYHLSPEELELWAESLDRAGVPGLRVTRIQLYRDYPPPPPAARPAGHPGKETHGIDLSADRLR